MANKLSLPHQARELGQYAHYNLDKAAFAIYTLLCNNVQLQDVASALEKQWLEQGNEDHLVRRAPAAEFDSLQGAVRAHVAMIKSADAGAASDLEWWPTGFIVLVREDWRTNSGGLSFVFADEEKDYELDKFFFKLEDAYMMLSSLSFGDEELARSKVIYGQEFHASPVEGTRHRK
jgi:hypothetical protein